MPEFPLPIAKITKDKLNPFGSDDFWRDELDETTISELPPEKFIDVEGSQKNSSYEIARAVITAFLEPITELEERGLLKNVRVVFFGSAVDNFKKPSDLDILIVADGDIEKHSDLIEELSVSANARMLELLFIGGGEFAVRGTFPNDWFPDGLHYQFLTPEEFIEEATKPPSDFSKAKWLQPALAGGAILIKGENILDEDGHPLIKREDTEFLG